MIILGVTGNIGSGKTTVSDIFKDYGAKIINVDNISHRCLDKNKGLIKKRLKKSGLDSNFGFKRQDLAQLVFKDKEALNVLCDVLHPCIIENIEHTLTQFKKNDSEVVVVIDCALLFEMSLDRNVDCVIVVNASLNKRIKRLVLNGEFTESDIRRREKMQISQETKISKADFVINNEGNLSECAIQVEKIWNEIIKKKKG